MVDIKEKIFAIKRRPGMYMKEKKIEYIFYILSGYCGAKYNFNDIRTVENSFSSFFQSWLINWIKININEDYELTSFFWYDDIKKLKEGEEEQVDVFFELCESFFHDYENKLGYFDDKNIRN